MKKVVSMICDMLVALALMLLLLLTVPHGLQADSLKDSPSIQTGSNIDIQKSVSYDLSKRYFFSSL
jgi:hypothetical protein